MKPAAVMGLAQGTRLAQGQRASDKASPRSGMLWGYVRIWGFAGGEGNEGPTVLAQEYSVVSVLCWLE